MIRMKEFKWIFRTSRNPNSSLTSGVASLNYSLKISTNRPAEKSILPCQIWSFLGVLENFVLHLFLPDFPDTIFVSNSKTKCFYANQSDPFHAKIPFKQVTSVRIREQEMFVFQKIWSALFSCNTHFEIRPFALLLMILLPASIINHYFSFCASCNCKKVKGSLAFSGVIEMGYCRESWLMRVLEWICWWE